ncbi:response regulator transcription factor [Pleurocapsa sp. PCC 7319]|uniref:response regulator n=1 Tax=Pleurocapsa sp. PCC 7319 TaxID=118161 RepID=UPI00034B0FAE|nr:response regulator transcription factor [Pleurocapsa sp. PCC 7319]
MIRILIVDDQNIVREGIKILLEQATEIEVVGAAEDGNIALQEMEKLQPDIVLLDINMPGIDGLTVADKIRDKFPQVKIIMLSSYEDEQYVQKATALGAKGYLLKSASSQQLEWSIKLVHQGYSAIKSDLLEKQFSQTSQTPPQPQAQAAQELPPQPQVPSQREFNRESKFNYLKIEKPTIEIGPKAELPKAELPKAEPPKVAALSRNNQHQQRNQNNLNQLELLLAKNHTQPKSIGAPRQQRRKTPMFHSVRLTQVKKTMKSFEFKLLIFIILFSLSLLVFIALS